MENKLETKEININQLVRHKPVHPIIDTDCEACTKDYLHGEPLDNICVVCGINFQYPNKDNLCPHCEDGETFET